jgi:hypothetical protein
LINETMRKMQEILRRRDAALNELVNPARAAVNQMRDAGMARGAGPLEEALFRYDAVEAELKAVVEEDPQKFINALLESIVPPEFR